MCGRNAHLEIKSSSSIGHAQCGRTTKKMCSEGKYECIYQLQTRMVE